MTILFVSYHLSPFYSVHGSSDTTNPAPSNPEPGPSGMGKRDVPREVSGETKKQKTVTPPSSNNQPGPSGVGKRKKSGDDKQVKKQKSNNDKGPSVLPEQQQITGEIPYSFHLRSVRVFKKNKAADNTYEVTFNTTWRGRNLSELFNNFHLMFYNLLRQVTAGRHPDDLIRNVIRHQSLHHPIIVPLMKISELNPDIIMEKIENTLNINEILTVDETFKMDIGIIEIPRGGSLAYITCLMGMTLT